MRNKRFSFLIVLSFIAAASIFAHGKSDVEEIEVENLNSWQESFDLEGKASNKAVKYNIVINARDLSGNEYIEGPYNLYIDPNSDLPICGITNPSQNMRVVGNLNIVGTCVDDDAVSYVELVFDGDEDHPIRADGREFWSYYLDTLNLQEGPHTIKVTGYDINGLASKPIYLTWQLDRNQPVTEVQDKTMGMLVSGKVEFNGLVTDGNGIKELYYSVDNGEYFNPVKFTKTKDFGSVAFSLTVDTKQFADGPAVIWFKAVDNAGSTGVYSFLYFIDNTKPDVEIVYPTVTDVMNGKFTVAGYAKDTVGITKLTWTFGDISDEFDLVPGNPYWAVTLDTVGATKEKSRKFTVHAVDKAGNIIDKTMNILLNQEDDKPVVEIASPTPGQVFNGDDELVFVRGIAKDDDSVKTVKVQLDDQEPILQTTKGVFYQELCKASDLSAGNHKITVTAIDENDVEGNPFVVTVSSKGVPPVANNPVIVKGKESVPFVNGMEIHPEDNASFSVNLTSEIGIQSVKTKMIYGKNGISENEILLKNVSSYNLVLPITPESPKGLYTYIVNMTDSIGRESEAKYYMYVTNTSVIKSDVPRIVFSDSTVGEDGSIVNNPEYPVTGYLIGANISSIELVPETPFARVESKGNLIKLIPGNAIGSSEPIVVTVTTDKGAIVESDPLIFRYDNVLPTLNITNYSDSQSVNGLDGYVGITGSVSCSTGVGGVSYRIIGAQAEIKTGLIGAVKNVPATNYTPVKVEEDGTFKINIDTDSFGAAMSVVEVVAESAGGNKITKAVAISTIPPLPETEGKPVVPKAPVIAWIDGNDVYAVGIYQGNLNRDFFVFPKSEMEEGSNPITASVTPEGGKEVAAKYTAIKNPTLHANFALVNGESYYSGKTVVLPYGPQKVIENYVTITIDTGATVNSVTYEITGEEVPGGDLVQRGTAKITKPVPGDTRWTADIPLNNLPARINDITVTIKAGTLEETIKGSVAVTRSVDSYLIDDLESLYTLTDTDTVYDTENENWVLKNNSKYYIYANIVSPIKAELVSDVPGLILNPEEEGKLYALSAEKDGLYRDVKIIFTDGQGNGFETPLMNFLADSEYPEVVLQTPVIHQWVGDLIKISGTAADSLGVREVEYSLDNGANWTPFVISGSDPSNLGVTFNEEVDASKLEDGLVELNVRALDNAGHYTEVKTAVFKDTTPPKAKVILPLAEDVVNGETLVVFQVEDNGYFNEVLYTIRKEGHAEEFRKAVAIDPLVSTYVGTEEMPIDDLMTFVFSDEAGNKGLIESWQFAIENESDLPRAEIHVPEELEVVTRDFTISGVIYDDDGDSTIWYKIDDGDYIQISEPNTSFSIDVPIVTMTDNEHTVSVYAVDVNGVRGEEITRTFRVSLEEPKGEIYTPTIDTSVSNVFTMTGVSSDKNGIAKIEVSLDNGNSYNDAEGTEEWSYTVDSRSIPDGTQVVFLRITDNYGIVGLYSSLINIDNEAPDISIELPLDDSITTGQLFFSGYAFDDVEITRLYITIRNMDEAMEPVEKELKVDYIIGETLDITELKNGYYNIQVTGEDRAGNKTNVSRNIHLDKTMSPAQVDILYPLNGEHKNGQFNIYGQAASNLESPIRTLKLFVDDIFVKETDLSNTGFFKFTISPSSEFDSGEFDEEGNPIKVLRADMGTGKHYYRVDAVLENGQQVSSVEQTITYTPYGPWVTLDNFIYGDFAINRPYIKGTAGYTHDPNEVTKAKAKDARREDKEILAAKAVAKVEISFDNGKTYEQISKTDKWQYRVENEDLPEGYHFMLIRATMKNGEVAIDRFIIQVDNTAPTVRLIAPDNGGRYNQKMEVSGLSQDDVRLESVTLALRKGDKAGYELPSFVQGLYLDFRMFGATFFDIGAGLTFFDDNVKLQVGWGQYTQSQMNMMTKKGSEPKPLRYGGNAIFNLKILANISTIPFSYFLGRDWDWLSASFAIGAEFASFNESGSMKIDNDGPNRQVLSALVGQIEFPRIHLSELEYFSTFSIYTEGSLWFMPSDVGGDIERSKVKVSVGVRANVF